MLKPCEDCIHRDECSEWDKNFCAENDFDRKVSEINYYDYLLKEKNDLGEDD